MKNEKQYTEKRWAIIFKSDCGWHFAGKYMWEDATENEPIIRTYKTRAEARKEKKEYTGSYYKLRIVIAQVEVIVRINT